jgi:hypothetical protein
MLKVILSVLVLSFVAGSALALTPGTYDCKCVRQENIGSCDPTDHMTLAISTDGSWTFKSAPVNDVTDYSDAGTYSQGELRGRYLHFSSANTPGSSTRGDGDDDLWIASELFDGSLDLSMESVIVSFTDDGGNRDETGFSCSPN